MNAEKERLKIALNILQEDLKKHKDWQNSEKSWEAVLEKLELVIDFVHDMN